jgi:hypothetical protein
MELEFGCGRMCPKNMFSDRNEDFDSLIPVNICERSLDQDSFAGKDATDRKLGLHQVSVGEPVGKH